MSLEAGVPGQTYTREEWQMVCCRYYTAGKFVSGKRVLEAGCGTGRGLGYLSTRAKYIIGGDYGRDNIQRARSHYGSRIDLLLLDAQRLPFQNSSFEVVLAMEVIYYFTSLEDFLEECHRVLGKGGLLCFCLPNKDVPGFHASLLSQRYYSVPELVGILQGHRFSPEVFGASPIWRQAAYQKIRSEVLAAIDRFLGTVPGGRAIKEFLRKTIYRELIVNKHEIEESDMEPDSCHLEPLAPDLPDHKYRVIYVVAHAE